MGLFFVLKSKLLAEKASHEYTSIKLKAVQDEVQLLARTIEVLRTDYAIVVADLHKTLDENTQLALALANRSYKPVKKAKKKLAKKK